MSVAAVWRMFGCDRLDWGCMNRSVVLVLLNLAADFKAALLCISVEGDFDESFVSSASNGDEVVFFIKFDDRVERHLFTSPYGGVRDRQ